MPSPRGRREARDPGRVPLRRRDGLVRRLLSAALMTLAVALGLTTLRPAPPAGTSVLVASRDLDAGAVLAADDVTRAVRPSSDLPTGALTPRSGVPGRVLTSAVRRGEVLTDVRVVGPALLAALTPGQVAAPVRIADPRAAALVQPGDHVDVLVAAEGGGPASAVTSDATVLARPRSDDGLLHGAPDDGLGGLLLLEVTGEGARALAGAAARGPLSLALRAR